MRLDLDKVSANAREAETEDLLDRVTVYRDGMEPAALDILEAELRQRGISHQELETHAAQRRHVLRDETQIARKCTFCHRPAAKAGWGWHRLWGWIPVFPRRLTWCDVHLPGKV